MYQRIIALKERNRSGQGRICRATNVANDILKFQPRVVIYNLQAPGGQVIFLHGRSFPV